MPALSALALLARKAVVRAVCAASLRSLTLLVGLALASTCGCETESSQRFHRYSDEGIHLYERGDYVGARDHFELALPIGPKDANLLYNLGQCHDRLGQVEQAEHFYQQCLDVNANHAECRHALTVLLYRRGRRAEADQMIEHWLANQPKLAGAYVEDGWRLRQSGELQLAVGRYQQALHHDPRNQRAMIELGQVYEQTQQPEFALTVYSRALELNPRQPDVKDRINQLKAKGVGKPKPDG